jgi:hypothetical protein
MIVVTFSKQNYLSYRKRTPGIHVEFLLACEYFTM